LLALALTLAIAQVPGTSLASALAAARSGDTVRVRAGVHHGRFTVDRPMTIIGAPGAVLDGGRRGSVITVRADSVSIESLAIRASGRSLDLDQAAVRLERCTGCRVIGNTITDPLHGIYLLESHGVVIAGNEIAGAADLAEGARGNGIHLYNSSGNHIDRNRIRGTRDGIYFSFASGNLVSGNTVTRARYGLHYMYSDDNRFEGNSFTSNAAGAAIMFSKRIVLLRNSFSRHTGYRAYGILLQTAEQVVAEGNRIEGNLTGVFLDGTVADTFRANLIAGNGIGIDLLASAEGNAFHGNIVTDNRVAVRKVLGAGVNAWDDGARGNYWSDPAVYDLDGDGMGDRPHAVGDVYTALAATRPALELFSGTLAARALAWAEEAFPVFAVPRVEDRFPLARRPALELP
jgi:nitrous oxidase accessory protein